MATSNTDTGDTLISTEMQTTQRKSLDTNFDNEHVDIPAPRESLITTAVNFLQNQKVRHTTLTHKQQFLRSKGLSPEEIQLACERAGVFTQDPNSPTYINMGITAQTQHSQMALQSRPSAFGRMKEILHSLALLGGVAYAIYMFWKQYIERFLFGKKKRKPIDECLEDIDKKVDIRIGDVNREIIQLKEFVGHQQREQHQQLTREFNQFRSDLDAIKGLLLNRKQFASPLTAGPPSIPAWQLSASSPHRLHHHHHHNSQSDDNEKADDAGSGSGSSETEVVTKNSDSSLEIM